MRKQIGILAVVVGLAILGTSWWVIVSGRVAVGETASAVPTVTSSQPPCPGTGPLIPVTDEWSQLISTHYAAESLTVKSVDTQAQLLDVQVQVAGNHLCVDAASGQLGAYRGTVPAGATAAVRIRVDLDSDDFTKTPAFVTLASWGNGWKVVDVESGIALSLVFVK